MPATVKLHNKHNHAVHNAEALLFRRIDPFVKNQFFEYFSQGLSPTAAMQYHITRLEMDTTRERDLMETLADAAQNPKSSVVYSMYSEWRAANFGERCGDGMMSLLEQKLAAYKQEGADVKVCKEPMAIVIVTPLMKRAHQLRSSKDIAFMDSTASCDSDNHSITFLMLSSMHGAIPGGIIITEGQRECDYSTGLSLFKEILGDAAFNGQGFPSVFITDDSAAEAKALKKCFPQSSLYLCRFHMLQSVWRWLWDKKHGIELNDRKGLMQMFQRILYAVTEEEAEIAYQLVCRTKKYNNFAAHVENLWGRRQQWCYAYSVPQMRGHHTNNFSEITVRIFKDNVLTRCKAYNAIALVDLIVSVFERFYKDRLLNFAHGRVTLQHLLFGKLMKRADYISDADLIKPGGNNMYLVPSEKDVTVMYSVDGNVGCCSCSVGMDGSCCKHQIAVYKFFYIVLPNLPATSRSSRYEAAMLALGEAAPTEEFFSSYRMVSHTVTRDSDVIDVPSSTNAVTCSSTCSVENGICSSESSASSNCTSVLSAWQSFASKVENYLQQNNTDDENVLVGIWKMDARFNKVHTNTQLGTFFHSTGVGVPQQYNHRSKIRVQPTSIRRRKTPFVTRGCKRQCSGRPVGKGPALKKRSHKLSTNILNNVPNAKSHGSGH